MIYPWKISQAIGEGITIKSFYVCTIEPCLEKELEGALIKAYLGKSKDSLDLIDLDIDIKDSVSAFGSFIKLIIGDRTVPVPHARSQGGFGGFDRTPPQKVKVRLYVEVWYRSRPLSEAIRGLLTRIIIIHVSQCCS